MIDVDRAFSPAIVDQISDWSRRFTTVAFNNFSFHSRKFLTRTESPGERCLSLEAVFVMIGLLDYIT